MVTKVWNTRLDDPRHDAQRASGELQEDEMPEGAGQGTEADGGGDGDLISLSHRLFSFLTS